MNPALMSDNVGRWTATLAVLLMTGAAAPTATAQPCEDGQWQPWMAQPAGRMLIAYDSARGVVVSFVPENVEFMPDVAGTTWESTGSEPWVKKASSGPGPRGGAAMAYDAARGVCVLFGGIIQFPDYRSDTWTWDGKSWTLVSNAGPEGRVQHSMTYDTNQERVLLFGGEGAAGRALGDTWAWNGTSWTPLNTEGPARRLTSLSFDAARRRAVLFGGLVDDLPVRPTDTWEFDGTTWTRAATTGPAGRYAHATTYDPLRAVTVLFGGSMGLDLGDTWEWDGVAWREVTAAGGPGPSQGGSMAYHSVLGRVVLASGLANRNGVLWDWDVEWTPGWALPISPPQWEAVVAYDSWRQRVIANVAERPGVSPAQTWEWDGESWEMRASGVGVPTGPMTFDTVRRVAVLLNDNYETWGWNGTTWNKLAVDGPARGPIAFDSDRGVAVLYVPFTPRQTWEWDGVAWSLREKHDPPLPGKPGGPENGFGASLCYDSNAHRTFLYGGSGEFNCCVNLTWEWDGTEWTRVDGGPAPRGRMDVSLAFDSARNRRVLFGGISLPPKHYGDTWESAAGVPWSQVDTRGPSPRAQGPAMTYDAARNTIVFYGGSWDGITWIRTVQQLTSDPSIATHPKSAQVQVGGGVTFRVEAAGEGTLSYQWRKDGAPLDSSGRIVGAQSEILSIVDVAIFDHGTYDVVVSNACGSVTSEAATLTVTGCRADFNADGALNSQDYFDYLIAFFELRLEADFDGSKTVDSTDYFTFLDAFFIGCA